jgi:hypothetical protein
MPLVMHHTCVDNHLYDSLNYSNRAEVKKATNSLFEVVTLLIEGVTCCTMFETKLYIRVSGRYI